MKVVIQGINEQKKIHAIKNLRAATGMSLKDAKDVIDDVSAGRERTVESSSAPRVDALLSEGYISFRVAQSPFVIDDFIGALSRFPAAMTVGDLCAVLRPASHLQGDR
ncbi:MAG: ribosomal protein L7/L12 [Solirubrobacteraceae bacterium]